MASTYEPIATTTLGSATATITFSSISSAYTDLRLVFVYTTNTANRTLQIRYNNDSSALYSSTRLWGDGTTVTTDRNTNGTELIVQTASTSATIPVYFEADIFSYAGSTYKTGLFGDAGDKNGSGQVGKCVGLWRSTSAITAVRITAQSSYFVNGSTANLYGIAAA